jgi:hypothetical protein
MENYISLVPTWVSVLFSLSFLVAIYFISNEIKIAATNAQLPNNQPKRLFWGIIVFFGVYLGYASIMSLSGFFSGNSFPPKALLFTTIPFMIFVFAAILNKPLYWKIIDNMPLEKMVGLHIIRLIGFFFLLTAYYRVLPNHYALMAGIGDVSTAIGSIFVSRWIIQKKSWSKQATVVWNIYGLIDIIAVIISTILTSRFSLDNHTQGITEIAKFPLIWIPAFAPVVIIFMHIAIFKKLKRQS